ncbi:hypothetical protein PG997_006019 [Apiospora hydei]|uniref:Mitochondrial inner membrane protease subunit n=1 Tax=Apiospora hydei TaxID=1337664 RepID=A0ABR1WMK1_9PEZI
MSPTYNPENSLTGRFYYIGKSVAPSELRRGMFISFRYGGNPSPHSVVPLPDEYSCFCLRSTILNNFPLGKRLTGLEGDIVRTRRDCTECRHVRVPPGTTWAEGDAGAYLSEDSNDFGPIPLRNVVGVVTFILYPFKYWGRVRWWEYQDIIMKARLVTDPKEVKALEEKGAKLDFVMSRASEQDFIQRRLKEQEESGEIDYQAEAVRGMAAQFLQEASVRCLQVRAANRAKKANAKVGDTAASKPQKSRAAARKGQAAGTEDTVLGRWMAHGARSQLVEKDVVLLTLPSAISEEDQRVLRKKAELTKEKTGWTYQFRFVG